MLGFVPQPNLRKASNYRELISKGEPNKSIRRVFVQPLFKFDSLEIFTPDGIDIRHSSFVILKGSTAGKFPQAVDLDCKRTGTAHQLSTAASMSVVEKVIE
jgi:hypothetical protein